jgi:hypothetical protein
MNKFKAGDKVVALVGQTHPSAQPRVKGKIYEVVDIMFCHREGHQMINLGYGSEHNTILCSCGKKHFNNGLMWTDSAHFAKVDEVDKALEKAVAEEDYDLAIILRDINK